MNEDLRKDIPGIIFLVLMLLAILATLGYTAHTAHRVTAVDNHAWHGHDQDFLSQAELARRADNQSKLAEDWSTSTLKAHNEFIDKQAVINQKLARQMKRLQDQMIELKQAEKERK